MTLATSRTFRFFVVIALAVSVAVLLYSQTSTTPKSLVRRHDSHDASQYWDRPDPLASQNGTLHKRANDGNSGDRNWWPSYVIPAATMLDESKIDDLDGPHGEDMPDHDRTKIKAVARGWKYLCTMRSRTEKLPTKPEFKPGAGRTVDQIFQEYGWKPRLTLLESGSTQQELDPFKAAFEDLGINTDYKWWLRSNLMHEGDIAGKYPGTYGSYNNYFDLTSGVLVATNNWSPEESLRRSGRSIPKGKQLVPFARWSDVVWNALQQAVEKYGGEFAQQNKAVKKLEHVFRYHIVNEDTEETLKMITGFQRPQDVGAWPGQSFPISELQAVAALSTANSKGVAWLFGQHKEAMGVRAVDRVNIFCCGFIPGWCMYMHVADSPT